MRNDDLGYAKTILRQTYRHFNNRDIDAVRRYWTRQWTIVNPHVEPILFLEEKAGRINVTVHQVVHDLEGNLLVDQLIHHVYTIKNGLIISMEIQQVG